MYLACTCSYQERLCRQSKTLTCSKCSLRCCNQYSIRMRDSRSNGTMIYYLKLGNSSLSHFFYRSNAVLPSSGTKVYKPDFAVFSHIINKKCLLLVSEFKPTKQNSAIESDLVKLGHQMRSTYNALVRNRVDQPFVCGVRSEGTRLTTYVMDMPSPHLYRMTKLSELSLFENVEQLSVLPNIVMKLTQLKVSI